MSQKSVRFEDKVRCVYYVIPEGNRLRPVRRKVKRTKPATDPPTLVPLRQRIALLTQYLAIKPKGQDRTNGTDGSH